MSAKKDSDAGLPQAKQYLSFAVGAEEYAVDILRVQEIKCYAAVTPIPNAPAHVKGLMNLRGSVVPVVDLRIRFGIQAAVYAPTTVIVLVIIKQKVVGLIVDRVSDVLDIAADTITAAPDFGSAVDTTFLDGVARVDERLLGIVNVDVVSSVEPHVTPYVPVAPAEAAR